MTRLQTKYFLVVCCSFAFILLCACQSQPKIEDSTLLGDWYMEGYNPQRNRNSTESLTLPLQNQIEYDLSEAVEYASPVTIANGLLFAEGEDALHVLSLQNGQEAWQFKLNGSYISPAVVGETVYVRAESGADGYIYGLTAATGTKLWQYKFSQLGSINDNIGGHVTAPVIVDGFLIVGAAKTVEALDAKSGKPRWRTELKDAISSSMAVADGVVYATDLTTLYALDLESGEIRWQQELGQIPPLFSPIIAGDKVYVTTKDSVHALNRVDGKTVWAGTVSDLPTIPAAATDERVYVKTVNQLFALNSATGELLWRYDSLNYVSIPALTKDYIFVVTRADGGSQLRVLQPSDGAEVWRSENLDVGNGGPVIAGSTVYLRTKSGKVLGFRAKL